MQVKSSSGTSSDTRASQPLSWRRIVLVTMLVMAAFGLVYWVKTDPMLAMQRARADATVASEPSYWNDKTPQLRALSDLIEKLPHAKRLKVTCEAIIAHASGSSVLLYDRDTRAISRVTKMHSLRSFPSIGHVFCESWKPVTDDMVQAAAQGQYRASDPAYMFNMGSCE